MGHREPEKDRGAWLSRITIAAVLCANLVTSLTAADLVSFPDLGLRLQRGFNIRLVADSDTAPDTWCMTFDASGRLVVGNSQSIRTLTDTDGDGVADTAIIFARVTQGVMGLCFEGASLYAVADGSLMRLADADGDGVADGPGERLLSFGFGEHGAHAIKRGPDGSLYLMGGNDAAFGQLAAGGGIRKIEGGALLRLGPGGRSIECVAHGFRNCYDFDFNALGDVFTFDSDAEGDLFLPWYLPTRTYHVGVGQHHGWRLAGYKRSWPRPPYYADTAEPLWRIGRGSPTGVLIYRHTQFPPAFRDMLFFCDWTFGRVLYSQTPINGAGYGSVAPDVFLEPMGLQGFAPTSMAVAPDGALYISIGGRKTRGAVYRIEYTGAPVPSLVAPLLSDDLNAVLLAPQPLDAWSRAQWVPIAQRVGAQAFAAVATDESVAAVLRVRAIEVLTEVFGGLPAQRVGSLAQTADPVIRARVAWSLGRAPGETTESGLMALAADRVPFVRRCALEALMEQPELLPAADLARIISVNLGSTEKRIRLAAISLASRAPDDTWQVLIRSTASLPALSQAGVVLAEIERSPDALAFPALIPRLTNALAMARDPGTRLDVVRTMIRALGDFHLNDPSVEVFTGYEPPTPPGNELAILRPVRTLLPSGDLDLDFETARLLAMLQDDDPRVARVLAQSLTDRTFAAQDFHFLVCLARLRSPLADYASRIAYSVLNLDRKLGGQELHATQNWDARLRELVQQLNRREPSIGDALLRDPRFPSAAHVNIAFAFDGERRLAAARRFYGAVRNSPAFPWSPALVELLSELPREEVFPLFRRQAGNPGVRDAIVLKLAAAPTAADRPIFLGSLMSPQPQVAKASLDALLKLPADGASANLINPLRFLRRSLAEPQDTLVRAQLIALLSSSFKQPFKVEEPLGGDADAMKSAYQPVFDWVARKYPGLARVMNADDGEDPGRWAALLRTVPWRNGDAARGEQVYIQRGCAACHSGGGAIGPDLAGVTSRLSRDDVMSAIAFPSRDIAPAYRATFFRLRNGQTVNGMIAFESADGWIVQTGAGASLRLDARDVISHEPSSVSLMPARLTAGLSPLSLADLYAYLASKAAP